MRRKSSLCGLGHTERRRCYQVRQEMHSYWCNDSPGLVLLRLPRYQSEVEWNRTEDGANEAVPHPTNHLSGGCNAAKRLRRTATDGNDMVTTQLKCYKTYAYAHLAIMSFDHRTQGLRRTNSSWKTKKRSWHKLRQRKKWQRSNQTRTTRIDWQPIRTDGRYLHSLNHGIKMSPIWELS